MFTPTIMLRPTGLLPYDSSYPVPPDYDQKKTAGAKPCRRNLNDPLHRAEVADMVTGNMGLAGNRVKWLSAVDPTSFDTMTYDEALSEATMGLFRAAQLYDPQFVGKGGKGWVTVTYKVGKRKIKVSVKCGERLLKFCTYATWWVCQALQRGHDRNRLVHDLIGNWRAKRHPTVYLTSFRDMRENGSYFKHDDTWGSGEPPDHRATDPDDDLHRRGMCEAVDRLLAVLPERYRRVMELRFLEGRTLDEVGKLLGVTRERVRQLQSKSLAILRRRAHLVPQVLPYLKEVV